MTSGKVTPRWRARARTRIQPEANAATGSGKRRDHRSLIALGGQMMMCRRDRPCWRRAPARCRPRSMPRLCVVARDRFHRAVDIDRSIVSGRAQHRHHALRLAERIGADQVRAFGKQLDRAQQLGNFAFGVVVAEHRQAEGRLGYKYVARNNSNRRTCRIGDILVVT